MKKSVTNWLSAVIRKAYLRTGGERGLHLPIYINLFGYELALYAMNMDWESLRIKITHNESQKIVWVLKKGKY